MDQYQSRLLLGTSFNTIRVNGQEWDRSAKPNGIDRMERAAMTDSNSYLKALTASPKPPSLKKANAALKIPRYFFDRRDHELIRLINAAGVGARDMQYIRKRYYRHFHPHGIKEMAESRSLRIAYAMVHLLTSLEVGGMDDRLDALRSLRAEVLDPAEAPRPTLTGRPLPEEVAEVLAQRAPLYEGVAHATLDAAQAPAALLDQAVAALASVTGL
jgi:hypothetical protein